MKMNNKKGFSLAEVLISVGIVSVIATLGFSVTRTNIDRAYDKYIYTGAAALSDVLTDAEATGNADNVNDLVDHAAELFNVARQGNTITARNGVEYQFIALTNADFGDGVTRPFYRILMTPPTSRDAAVRSYEFLHTNVNNYPALFPRNIMANNQRVDRLDQRVDLLKYYLRDPAVVDVPRERSYSDFRQIACSKYGTITGTSRINNNGGYTETRITILDCNDINNVIDPNAGIVTMVRP